MSIKISLCMLPSKVNQRFKLQFYNFSIEKYKKSIREIIESFLQDTLTYNKNQRN